MIYLTAKIIACSFLKDSFMAAFFPEMKTTMKKNVLNKVQHTFEPNWWGEEADFEEDNEETILYFREICIATAKFCKIFNA